MLDVTASYEMPLNFITFFANFAHNWRSFMPEVLYLHQAFADCVYNQCIHFEMLTCQM